MVEADVRKRAVKHARDEGVIRWALDNGLEPETMLQLLDDFATIEDRIDFVDAMVWLGEEIQPVEPDIGIIEGRETGLFYRGAVNMLYGTDNCGKTLMTQAIVVQQLAAGNEVIYLDAEEGSPRNMFLRLQSMGCDPSWGERFHYANINKAPSQANRDMFVEVAKRCSLAVIDSVGEFMGMYGKDATKDLETRNVLFEMFGRPLAAAGAAVLALDHISKSSDGSQPIGTIRKRAAVDGAAYYLSVDEGNEWSKTKSGFGSLLCTKDRNGTYHRNQKVARVQVFPAATSPDGHLVVELSYSEFDDMMDEELIESPPATTGPIDIELEVLRLCEEYGPLVRNRDILDELNRHAEKKMTRTTFEALIRTMRERGFVEFKNGHVVPLISTLRNRNDSRQ